MNEKSNTNQINELQFDLPPQYVPVIMLDEASLFGFIFDIATVILYNKFIVPCFPFNYYVCTKECKPTRKQGTPRASTTMNVDWFFVESFTGNIKEKLVGSAQAISRLVQSGHQHRRLHRAGVCFLLDYKGT